MRIKYQGIFDLKTLKLLKDLGISDFVFDRVPTSFQFIQFEKLLELTKDLSALDHCYLLFKNESEFSVGEFSKKFEENVDNEVVLQFDQEYDPVSFSKSGYSFFWHYNEGPMSSKITTHDKLKGIVIPFSICEAWHEKEILSEHAKNLAMLKKENSSKTSSPFQIGLSVSYTDNIFPSLFEYIHFDFVQVKIDDKVESGFQTIDQELLEDSFYWIRKVVEG